MDRQIQHHQNQQPPQTDQENNSNGGAKGSFLCRQSSTRWTPTTDQIRILKELYYTNGLRSPNAEQIQRISARLRQYGKIEGKNVFYWFQNHKARERQKKRLTNEVPMQHQRNVSNISSATWKPEDYSKYSNFSDSSISTGGTGTNSYFRGTRNNNYGGLTADQYGSSPYTLSFERRKINSIQTLEEFDEDQEEEEEEGVESVAEIETLPLFPMQREDINAFCGFKHKSGNCFFKNRYGSDDHGSSLELSLNSYVGQSQEFI